MRRSASTVTVAITLAALGLYAAQAASAVVPTNDTSAAATVVSSLPFNATVDTTSATTDAEDASLNADCGAPATEASVWYSYTAASDGAVVVDVSQSDYSAGVIVATGTPGSLSTIDCAPGVVADAIGAGETLYFMAFDDTLGSGNGGTLQISISSAPPPPVISVSVNPIGHFNSRTGAARISGSLTCTGADFISLEVDLTQRVGRVYIKGSGFNDFPCDGTSSWFVDVFGDNGRFSGGKAASATFSFACGEVFCSDGYVEQTVALRK